MSRPVSSLPRLHNGPAKCDKGHLHYSTPWTVYLVDPDTAHDVDKYGESLGPVAAFDTQEEVENLYKMPIFAKPMGPPSWSMGVAGGAIAVFQGGKFGFKSVKPEWEDPAAQNGGEFRFVFGQGQDPFTVIDDAFVALIAWMANHPVYESTQVLGLFIKNTEKRGKHSKQPGQNGGLQWNAIQFRVWISEIPEGDIVRLARTIGNDIVGVLTRAGAKGLLSYKGLDNLIRRAKAENTEKGGYDTSEIYLRFFIPPTHLPRPVDKLPHGMEKDAKRQNPAEV